MEPDGDPDGDAQTPNADADQKAWEWASDSDAGSDTRGRCDEHVCIHGRGTWRYRWRRHVHRP